MANGSYLEPPPKSSAGTLTRIFREFLAFLWRIAETFPDDPRKATAHCFIAFMPFIAFICILLVLAGGPEAMGRVYGLAILVAVLFIFTVLLQWRAPPPGFAIAHQARYDLINPHPMGKNLMIGDRPLS